MKKLSATAALLLVVSLCACPGACARGIPQGFDVFAEFGPSCLYGPVHSGASGQVKCEAGRFFTGVRLRLTRYDAVEASYSYSPHVFNEAYPLVYFNARLHSHSLNYVRCLSVDPHVQPFGTIGLGWENFYGGGYTPSGRPTTGDSEFAWNYGAGIDIIPQRFFAVRFECRELLTSIPVSHTSSLHEFVPSIGIVFRLNRYRKL